MQLFYHLQQLCQPLHFKNYSSQIEAHCLEAGIHFLDANQHLSDSSDNWYFVDSVHLSDGGNNACSQLIYDFISRP